jgi:hypothetical protein
VIFNDPAVGYCSSCRRHTWSTDEFGSTCDMTQPAGHRRQGVFRPFSAAVEGPLSPEDWAEIFSTVPLYPVELPDELRRTIAQAAIDIREAAEHMERGRRTGSLLDYQMPMSLLSSGLRRMEKYAP